MLYEQIGFGSGDGSNNFCVAPKAFQVVVETGLFREDMDDEIAVINQYPLACLVAFGAHRKFTELFQLPTHFIRDGLALAQVCRGTDDEVIREGCDFPKVQDLDADGLLRFSRLHRDLPSLQIAGGDCGLPVRLWACECYGRLSCA